MKEPSFISIRSPLNNLLTRKIATTGKLLGFLSNAATRHSIHSPFLYNLVDEVIRCRKADPACKPVERLRRELKQSRMVIRKTDYGKSPAGRFQPVEYPVSISHIANHSLTSVRHARRLFRLARFLNANTMLELGTSLGLTAAYLALARPGAQVITLEGCPELSRIARQNCKKLGIPDVEVVTGPFSETLTPALRQLGKADLIYIDGNHQEEAVTGYFEQCLDFITNDTVVVFDDIRHSEGMEEAWNKICRHERVKISLDLFFSGWILFRKESSREHFRLRHV